MNTQKTRKRYVKKREKRVASEDSSLQQYLLDHYIDFQESLSEISKSTPDSTPLVKDLEVLFFNFDGICQKIYGRKAPKSADALGMIGKNLLIIEFKDGFQQKLPKDKVHIPCNQGFNLNNCPERGEIYHKKFEEMKESVKLKAAESYLTYRENLLLSSVRTPNQVQFFLVISLNSLEQLEDTMLQLSKTKEQIKNEKEEQDKIKKQNYNNLRDSLKRFTLCPKQEGGTYLYQCVHVMNPEEFREEIKRRAKKSEIAL